MAYTAIQTTTMYLAMEQNKKLTPVMQDAITKLRLHGFLVRWSGGYWTRQGCPVRTLPDGETKLPEWYFNKNTIQALYDRGVIEIAEQHFNSHTGKYHPTAVKLTESFKKSSNLNSPV